MNKTEKKAVTQEVMDRLINQGVTCPDCATTSKEIQVEKYSLRNFILKDGELIPKIGSVWETSEHSFHCSFCGSLNVGDSVDKFGYSDPDEHRQISYHGKTLYFWSRYNDKKAMLKEVKSLRKGVRTVHAVEAFNPNFPPGWDIFVELF